MRRRNRHFVLRRPPAALVADHTTGAAAPWCDWRPVDSYTMSEFLRRYGTVRNLTVATLGAMGGFAVMMLLDVALG